MSNVKPQTKSFKEIITMKSSKLLMIAIISAIFFLLLLLITGCKTNVAEPIWDKPYTAPVTPRITSVVPAQAAAGVGTITITGENFANEKGTNVVYFDNTASEVISSTSTSITVRRPNVATDSAEIKVVSNQALMAVKYSPYKVERVLETYGNFTQNVTLNVVVADKQENLYVIEGTNIHKVAPGGETIAFATANRATTDANLGPDGNLYLMGNNRTVDKVDLTTGTVDKWVQMPTGKSVKYGDFDDSGNFYTGGKKTDLLVVGSDLKVKPGAGYYNSEEILAVRCFNNYVYVATKTTSDTSVIYRNQIDANGNLGAKELVLNMRTTGEFASRSIKGLTFSSSGLMYIATDSPNPILIYNPADGNLDFLYKEILRPYCKSFCWGTGNFIYMINGNATVTPPEDWKVYRVNTGIKGIQ